MTYRSNKWTYAVTPLGGAMPTTGATSGTPTSGRRRARPRLPPWRALRASDVIAALNTAWNADQYVVLGDTTRAFWDGDS